MTTGCSLDAGRDRVHTGLASSFDAYGRFVARNPVKVIAASFSLFVIMCTGLIRLTPEYRANYLYMPTKSKSFLDWRYLEEHFGVDGHSLVLYAKARSDNIFDFDGLTQLLRAHKYTVELEAQVGGKDGPEGTRTGAKTVKYTDACQRHPQADEREGVDKCLFETFLSLWDFDQNQLIGSRNSILDRLTALQQRSNIEAFAGGVDYDEDTAGVKRVKGAKAVVLFFPLNSASGAAYDIQPAWNDGVYASVDSSVIEVFHYSQRSFDDEVARLISDDIPLYGISLFLITTFMACTLGPLKSLHRSRVLLGVMTIVNVLLAVGAGFGIASAIGVHFPSIAALLPLIVMGVEVDAAIIMVDSLNAEPEEDKIEARIGRSLSRSGPAVLVTSLTTICAFATSTTADLPAIAMFASFAALSFTAALFVCLSFFVGVLVLDERRLQARRVSFAPCARASLCGGEAAQAGVAQASAAESGASAAGPSKVGSVHAVAHVPPSAPSTSTTKLRRTNLASELERVEPLQSLIRTHYAPALLRPAVSIVVVCAFAALTVLSALSIPYIKVGLPSEDVLPDDSYVKPALRVEDSDLFGGRTATTSIVLTGYDWENERTRDAYYRLRRAIIELEFVKSVPPDWLTSYGKWRAAKGIQSEEGRYMARLHEFLEGTKFKDNVICDRVSSCKHPSDVSFNVVYRTGTGDAIEALDKRAAFEAAMQKEGFENAFAFDQNYLLAETDKAIWYLTYTNMLFALAAILAIMLVFNPLPVAFWITVCVALIDVDLLGVLYLCNLKLNAVTYVNLVMAIGLSVDYCVHIAHRFNDVHQGALADATPGEIISAKESAIYALVTMGSSVMKGGFTTILGVFVIAFASSVAFRTFFTMIGFTVFFGMLHGMILLPVLLAYATLPSCSRGPRVSDGRWA